MRLRHRQDGSVPLAMIASIVTAGLITALVASVIQADRTARFDRSFTNVIQTADAGVQDAYHRLQHELLDIEVGETLGPFTTTLDGDTAEWEVERLTVREFEVTSRGETDGGTSRTVVVRIEEDSLFFPGAFGDRLVAVQGTSTHIDSYESWSTDSECINNTLPDRCWGTDAEFGTRKGALGTNNEFVFPGNVTVMRAILYDWLENPGQNVTDDNPGGDRCDGNACTHEVLRLEDDPLDYASDEHMQFVYDKLDDCDGREIPIDDGETIGHHKVKEVTLAPYSTDPDDNVGSPAEPGWDNYYCATDLEVVSDVVLDGATPETPVVIFVSDSFKLNGGIYMNCPNCPKNMNNYRWRGDNKEIRPISPSLQIYVGTDEESMSGNVTINQQAAFAGVMYAPRAPCGGGGAAAHIYGSLICGSLSQVGNWHFHYDEHLADFGRGTYTVSSWREDDSGL